MSDATTERRPTSEQAAEAVEQGGRSLRCFAKRWGPVLAFLILGGGAWQSIRSCVGFGASSLGIQTESKAKEKQAENDSIHQEFRGSLKTLTDKVETGNEIDRKIYHALPEKWRKK